MSTKVEEWLGKIRISTPPDIDCIGLKFRLDEISSGETLLLDDEKYVAIAEDFENRICISEKTGAVVSVGRAGERNRYFVNKDIDSFLFFAREFHVFDAKTRGLEAPAFARDLAELRSKLASHDPEALQEDAWWSTILEQVEQGLL